MTSEEGPLIDAFKSYQWDEAMEKVKTKEGREELRRQDRVGALPLHQACCFGAPLQLVESMVGAYPEAVRVTDDFDRLPLHLACIGGDTDDDDDGRDGVSPGVVRLLLRAHPDGAKAFESQGGLPLQVAASNKAPLAILKMLLDAYPQGAFTRNDDWELPVHLVDYEDSPEDEEVAEKVELLLRPLLKSEEACLLSDYLTCRTPLHVGAKFNVLRLQECVNIQRCPAEIIMTVAQHRPEELREMDERGNLPLHVVAANTILNGAQVECKSPKRTQNLNEVDSDNEHNSDSDESDEVPKIKKDLIGELVAMYPEAAAVLDGDERFPLNLAIQSGKKWTEGVEAITDAAEHVVTVMDHGTGLFPFMLACTVDDPCVTTVYSLLRRSPELKRYSLD